MAEQDQERSEPATPYKLREAKRRGQVAKSMEINSFVILAAGLAIAYMTGESMFRSILKIGYILFDKSYQYNLSASTSLGLFESIFHQLMHIFWPLMIALIVSGLLGNLAQTGPIFSTHPLKPDMDRLNPVSGFKRLFSKKLLFESFKTVLKLIIFGSIFYFSLLALNSKMLGMLDRSPESYGKIFFSSAGELAFKLMSALLVIAFLDLIYSRWSFSDQMRMSRREIQDEVKRREGDPQIKSKLRQLQSEAAKRKGSIQKVRDADVLITNPTHISIALQYKKNEMLAPKVIAKGSGELALKMREAARKYSIPIVENKTLARKIFRKINIDGYIPEELFPVVAKILLWVYAIKDGKSHDGIPRGKQYV